MDEPGLFADLSDEERQAIFADWSGLVRDSEILVLRYRADLSY